MATQWERLFKNLGEWQGSFTRFSPQGELLENIPTLVSFEGLNNNATMRQVVKKFPENHPPEEQVYQYSSLNQGTLFCENGAFSQGSLQWGPYADFGAELGLINGDRRLRLVQLYNRESQLDKLTLIRETLAGTNAIEYPRLTVDQLLGEWKGKATTVYRDLRPSNPYPTHLLIEHQGSDRLSQTLTFATRRIQSSAKIEGSRLIFDSSLLPIQILLLPDGASCNCPLEIQPRHPFVLELGWLINPTQRQRLVRSYNNKGEWESLTLIEEEKVS